MIKHIFATQLGDIKRQFKRCTRLQASPGTVCKYLLCIWYRNFFTAIYGVLRSFKRHYLHKILVRNLFFQYGKRMLLPIEQGKQLKLFNKIF